MMTRVRPLAILLVLLALAMTLRVAGIGFDLPFVYHPDEPFNISIVQSMLKRGDLDPRYFIYPSLFYYVNLAVYVPYYLVGKMLGLFHSRQDIEALTELMMGVTKAAQPSGVLLTRLVSAAASTGAVALTFLVGRRLFGSLAVATLAALAMAIVPTSVAIARYVTPDSFVILLASASLLASVLVYQQGRPWHYVLAALLAGLTASTKYNAALVGVSLVAAHFLRTGLRGIRDWKIWLTPVGFVAGFIAATPYAILDAHTFITNLRTDALHYSGGHPGMEGAPFHWYVGYMAATAGVLYALAALEMVRGIVIRSRPSMLLSAFPVVYFLFIISFVVRNDRTFLPLTPFLSLLAASFLVWAWDFCNRLTEHARRVAMQVALLVVAAAAFLQPAAKTLAETAKLMHPDGRETSRQWIAANLPPGSRIAFESYSPYIDPSRYQTLPIPRMVDHEPEWYVAKGFRYLVFSEGLYGRYFREPARYPADVAKYERFFDGFRLVRRFDDNDYEIRIYDAQDEPAKASGR